MHDEHSFLIIGSDRVGSAKRTWRMTPRVCLRKPSRALPPSRLQTLRARSRDQDRRSNPLSPSAEDLNDAPPALKSKARIRTPNAAAGWNHRRLGGKGLANNAPLTEVAELRTARTKETARGRATICRRQRRRQQISAEFSPFPEAHSQWTGKGTKARRPFAGTDGKGGIPRQDWVGRDIVWEETDHGSGEFQSDGGTKTNAEKGSAFGPAIGTPAEVQDRPWSPISRTSREVGSTDGLVAWRFVRPLCDRKWLRWIKAIVI